MILNLPRPLFSCPFFPSVFLDDDDRQDYLRLLGIFAKQNALAIHAYVLMSNHVHLKKGPEQIKCKT
jgi:REP element-mobilizing transposase RayT